MRFACDGWTGRTVPAGVSMQHPVGLQAPGDWQSSAPQNTGKGRDSVARVVPPAFPWREENRGCSRWGSVQTQLVSAAWPLGRLDIPMHQRILKPVQAAAARQGSLVETCPPRRSLGGAAAAQGLIRQGRQ